MSKTKNKKLGRPRKSEKWSAAEKLRVITEASSLDDSELGAFMRREGLYETDLREMREAALSGLEPVKRHKGPTAQEKQIKQLQRELRRKEKALAEAAALLVLKKKFHALLEAEDDDMDGHNEENS